MLGSNGRLSQQLLLIAVLLTTSCDKEHTKEYRIKNTLNDSILFSYTLDKNEKLIHVPNNSEIQIHVSSYFFGTVGVSDDRNTDDLSDFSIKFDTVEKAISEDKWNYEEVSKYHAKYTLLIDSTTIQ